MAIKTTDKMKTISGSKSKKPAKTTRRAKQKTSRRGPADGAQW